MDSLFLLRCTFEDLLNSIQKSSRKHFTYTIRLKLILKTQDKHTFDMQKEFILLNHEIIKATHSQQKLRSIENTLLIATDCIWALIAEE